MNERESEEGKETRVLVGEQAGSSPSKVVVLLVVVGWVVVVLGRPRVRVCQASLVVKSVWPGFIRLVKAGPGA